MSLVSANVRVAVTGGVFVNLDGNASVPTNATTPLGPEFDEVGYLTDAGIIESHDSQVNDLAAWQNGDVVRKVQTSHDVTFQLSLMETNPTTLEAYYGNYDNGHVKVTGELLPRLPWVFDVFDGDEMHRVVIPAGQITERGDVQRVNADAMAYPVTITAFPVDGVKAHIYLAQIASS